MKYRTHLALAGAFVSLISLTACSDSDRGVGAPTTVADHSTATDIPSTRATNAFPTDFASDDEQSVVPGGADALGAGFEGLYVGPDVRVESLAQDPPVRALSAPFPCDRLRVMLVAGNWDLVDRLESSPKLEASGVKDTVVLQRNGSQVWVRFSGAADCRAVATLALPTDLVLSLPAGDSSGQGWAITSRCTDRDGVRTVSVEMLTASGAGASVDIEIDPSGAGAVSSAIAGQSPIGWLRALAQGYADPTNPPPGSLYQVEGGTAEVTSTDRLRGSVMASATAFDLMGASGTARFGFPFACAAVEDLSLTMRQ